MSEDAIGGLVSLGLVYVFGAICWAMWWWREAQTYKRIGYPNTARSHARRVLWTPLWPVLLVAIGVMVAVQWVRDVALMARGDEDR